MLENKHMGESRRWIFYGMAFLSGFAGLLYQILWMRQLGLLFGNTSHAAALTLGMFFFGLAGGSWFFGRRSGRMIHPLKVYGWLELGIAVASCVFLLVLSFFHGIYPRVYQAFGPGGNLLLAKCFLTFVMVFPSSFFMGGTIPVLGKHLIRHQAAFGATAARIYGVNTIGAACGAFLTAFFLIVLLGFKMTCFLGIVISLAIAALSFLLAGKPGPEPVRASERIRVPDRAKAQPVSRRVIHLFAFISGFNVLALEVLWTRMFAQVHENSVYSFSVVLIVVLMSLALGALLASWLAGKDIEPLNVLFFLMVASGIGVCISPFVFMKQTDQLQMIETDVEFVRYVASLFTAGFSTIGPACLLLGTVFPFLMKSEERYASEPGRSIGMLSAINTVGAILGSLVCGFLLLRYLGMWRSVQVIALSYFLVALLVPLGRNAIFKALKGVTGCMLLISCFILDPSKLPVTAMSHDGMVERVIEVWEASDSTVSVVENPRDGYAIRINSNYSLGSSASAMSQAFQSRIPLLAFPQTQSVFYLGMGTGSTAGEALSRDLHGKIERVVVAELSPQVVTAARKYFSAANGIHDFTNGLFTDPRSTVLVEDGRNHLAATDATYDMINADLFVPYQSGTGSLYSIEHFLAARKRLNPGGVFVQWLPLYQVSAYEFGVIARTMLSAFDQVTLWRHNFQPGSEIVALVGHQDKSPLPGCDLDVAAEKIRAVQGATHLDLQRLMLPINPQTIPLFYCGNVTASAHLFASYPINSDDKPIIEYKTPVSLHRDQSAGKPHFVAGKFADLVDRLLTEMPPERDPILAHRDQASRDLVLAGAAFHRARIAEFTADRPAWTGYWEVFLKHWLGN